MSEVRKVLDEHAILPPRTSDGISVDANHIPASAMSAASKRQGHVFNNHELIWRGNDLCVGRSSTPIASIEPDKVCPGMWRVRHGNQLSDLTNITRARDAARSIALSLLNARRRTGLGAPLVEQNDVNDAASHAPQVNEPVRPGRNRTRLAAVGQTERARGGRGKRGGISEAARRAGISRFAAMRAAKRVRQRATKDAAVR
jgi:hypothetical protein